MFSCSIVLLIPHINCMYLWCSYGSLILWFLSGTVFICDVLMQHCFCYFSQALYLLVMFSRSIVFLIPHMNCIYLWCFHAALFFVIPLRNCINWWCSHAALCLWYFTWTLFICNVLMDHCFCDSSQELYLLVMFSCSIVFVILHMNFPYLWCSHGALFLWFLSGTVFIGDVLMQHCVCNTSQELYVFEMFSCSIVFVMPLMNRFNL